MSWRDDPRYEPPQVRFVLLGFFAYVIQRNLRYVWRRTRRLIDHRRFDRRPRI